MFKVRKLNAISVKGLEKFSKDQYELAEDIDSPDAIILRSHKLSAADVHENVKCIARAGAGTNNVPVAEMTARGVVVFNTPGANANAVKELVLSGLLLGSRGIAQGIEWVRSLDIPDNAELNKTLEAEKKRFKGGELEGKTLGVIGLGAIGSMVAEMGLSMGMDVVGFDPAISVEAAWRLPSAVKKMENVEALVANADFISLHVPAIPATKGMVNSTLLKSFKEGAQLINFARGEIVDVPSVIESLNNGRLKKYIADFPTPDLIGRDDVILMPHIGASTSEAEDNCAIMAAQQSVDFLENGNIRNSVNFPALALDRSSGSRITFTNSNVPKVLGNVLSVLADANLNVVDMINKSRDEVAYNIIDVEVLPSVEIVEAISAIEGVIGVRVID